MKFLKELENLVNQVEIITLERGLEVFFIPLNIPFYILKLLSPVGICNEPKEKPGISYLTLKAIEFPLLKLPRTILIPLFYYSFVKTELNCNYSVINIKTSSPRFQQVLVALRDYLNKIRFTRKMLEFQKEWLKWELEINDKRAETAVYRNFFSAIFGEDYFLYQKPLLVEKRLQNVEVKDLYRFYRFAFHPSKCKLLILGPIQENLKNILEYSIGNWKGFKQKLHLFKEFQQVKKTNPPKENQKYTVSRDHYENILLIGNKIKILSLEDYALLIRFLWVLKYRLQESLINKISSMKIVFSQYSKQDVYFVIDIRTGLEDFDTLERIVKESAKKILENGISEEEQNIIEKKASIWLLEVLQDEEEFLNILAKFIIFYKEPTAILKFFKALNEIEKMDIERIKVLIDVDKWNRVILKGMS